MKLLDGKLVSEKIKSGLEKEVREHSASNRAPHLAAILIGNDGASETYVASKIRSCLQTGIESTLIRLDANTSEKEILDAIKNLNEDEKIDGILVQLPLPGHVNEQKIITAIDPEKDVDGFHPQNIGKLVLGQKSFIPATPYGMLLMLEHYEIPTSGKHAVIIGRSNIVGKPMSILLSRNVTPGNCTVTLCHSKTTGLKEICLQADIIVAALGKPGFLKADMVKEGAVVLDVGITRIQDDTKKSGYKLKGDVDFDNVSPKCSFITPVPGGVGLMTIAALLTNTVQAWKDHIKP
ncbi:MAG: bifunctional methylenetetrahydrofolate dehydrogenase/methenyltetrahydrofolate cyclohydrolase FolD [Ferruginibacter sp.]